MARPFKPVNEEQLEKLAALGLSNAECASILDCSPDTIERNYADVMAWGREHRNASLRRKQFEVAMQGNPTMLIWLGKQFLGQKDHIDYGVGAGEGGPLQSVITVEFVPPPRDVMERSESEPKRLPN